MRVDLVEQHGGENLVYGILEGATDDGHELEICLKADQNILPELEDRLQLGFDPATAFVFRNDNGERLK